MSYLGDFPSTFTTVTCMFTTHAATGAPVAPSTAFENADVKIYKNGSATLRSSQNGVTMTSPFNSITGLHCLTIDLTDNTDAGFWVAGAVYTLVLSSDETVDGIAVAKVIGQFGIALAPVFARLGAPAGASIAADIAAVKTDTAAVKVKTDFLPSATAGAAGGVFIAGTNAATTVTTSFTTTFTGNLTGSVGSVTGLTASDVGAIKTKTDFLPSATAGAAGGVFIAGTNAATTITTSLTTTFTGNLTGSVGSVSGAVGSVTGAVGSVTGAVGSVTGNVSGNVTGTIGGLTAAALKDFFDTDSLTTYGSAVSGSVVKEIADNAAGSGGPSAATIAAAVWDLDATAHQTTGTFGQAIGDPGADTDTIWALVNTNLNATVSSRSTQTSVDDLPTNAELATALGTADDAVLAAIAALTIPSANANADALLDRADAIETGLTPRQAMRISAAADGGKLSGGATTTNTIRNAVADSKDRIVATVDADGNRTAITYDLT